MFHQGRVSGGGPRLATTQGTILGHQRAAARQESIWESSIAAGQAETGLGFGFRAFIVMPILKIHFLEKRSSLHHLAETLRKLVDDRSRNAPLVDLRFLEGMFDVVATGSEDIGVRRLLIYIIANMARWYELSWLFDRAKGKERFEAILNDPCKYMQKTAQAGLNFLNDPAVREGDSQQRVNDRKLQKLRFL